VRVAADETVAVDREAMPAFAPSAVANAVRGLKRLLDCQIGSADSSADSENTGSDAQSGCR